jgi:hypothetical protein
MKLPFDTVAGTILCGLLLTLVLYLLIRQVVMGS